MVILYQEIFYKDLPFFGTVHSSLFFEISIMEI